MTKLTSQNTVTRETATIYRGKPLVIDLHSGYVLIRRKGERSGYPIDYAAVYEAAGKLAARRK